MSYYYNANEGVRQLDDAVYAAWVASGNPKANYYAKIPDPPAPGYRFDGTEWVAPPVYKPQQVTAYQARAALLAANLLDDVEAAVSVSPDRNLKLAWEHALHFERNHPMISGIAGALGLSDEQLDELFLNASQIQ